MAGTAEFGLTGLAVMGQNLARNVARHGFQIAVHNRTAAKTKAFIEQHGHEGDFVASESIEDFVAALASPRKILIMVKAGAPVDAVIEELLPHLDPGDVLIDGVTPGSRTPAAVRRPWRSGTSASSGQASPVARRAPSTGRASCLEAAARPTPSSSRS